MFPEKPKRKRHKLLSIQLVMMLMIPALFISGFRSELDFGFYGDIFAMTVMICAAIYLTYQFVEWLIGQLW
jgi:hypothetical protein